MYFHPVEVDSQFNHKAQCIIPEGNLAGLVPVGGLYDLQKRLMSCILVTIATIDITSYLHVENGK